MKQIQHTYAVYFFIGTYPSKRWMIVTNTRASSVSISLQALVAQIATFERYDC